MGRVPRRKEERKKDKKHSMWWNNFTSSGGKPLLWLKGSLENMSKIIILLQIWGLFFRKYSRDEALFLGY